MDFSRTLFSLFVCCLELVLCGWQDNLRPNMFLQPRHTDYNVFTGNDTVTDHFSVILVAGSSLLVGARNVVYKLDIGDLKQTQSLGWTATEQDRGVCLVKGKNEESCQNYIKVLKKFDNDEGRYLICGTNAYKPVCREYVDDAGTYLMTNEENGIGKCPYGPDHNSTALLDGDKLYAGTAADYQGVDPIVYRDPLRTPQFDTTYLSNPSFVGSFSHQDFVYFFFREGAVEYTNCGKAVFSRVARVCKNDKGGTRSLNAKWTSFLKSRLNCSVPGNYPFYFDEIQDISDLIEGTYGGQEDQVVYSVLTTPPNSIGGSAICAFRLRDISDSFSGQFKEQRSGTENWLAVAQNRVPDPRPGTCSNNSKSINDASLNFIKTHPLMNDAVPPFFGSPVLIRTGLNTAFTTLDVDGQVVTPDGSKYDVMFVGTSTGTLLKAINAASATSRTETRPVVIEEIEVFDSSVAVKDVTVANTNKGDGKVIVTSRTEIKSFPLFRCNKAGNCHDCVALQDPYCAWATREGRCRGAISWSKGSQKDFLQSVPTGKHGGCPGGAIVVSDSHNARQVSRPGRVINVVFDNEDHVKMKQEKVPVLRNDVPAVEASVVLFSLETLIITVSAGAVAALVVGFVTGYCCGRRCQKDDGNVPYADADYEYFEQRQLPSRPVTHTLQPGLQPLLAHDKPQEETLYAEPILIGHEVNRSNPLGTTLGKPYPAVGMVAGRDLGLHPNNKFNTISNVHKRGGHGGHDTMQGRGLLMGQTHDRGENHVNHYERGGLLLLNQDTQGRGKLPDNFHGLGREPGNNQNPVYHMGTLSRASKLNSQNMAEKNQQVVDSAYGTTRSVKKVYL